MLQLMACFSLCEELSLCMSKVLRVKVGCVRCGKRIGAISWKERRVIRFDPFLPSTHTCKHYKGQGSENVMRNAQVVCDLQYIQQCSA